MIVQKLRLQRGWTQEQLATVSGLSTRTIQRIEQGRDSSLESLKSLAAVFEVDFQFLKEPTMESSTISQGVSADEALALHHVRTIRKFYSHALVYVVVMAALVAINLISSPHQIWVIYPALGWGVGLAIQGIRAFDLIPLWGADWEKRQVEKHLGRKL